MVVITGGKPYPGFECARGVGDLVLVYKRVTSLAGHTSRVSELLETVDRLSRADDHTTRELYLRNVSSSDMLDSDSVSNVPEAQRLSGDIIKFHKYALLPRCLF